MQSANEELKISSPKIPLKTQETELQVESSNLTAQGNTSMINLIIVKMVTAGIIIIIKDEHFFKVEC